MTDLDTLTVDELLAYRESLAKYSPDEARVPAGSPEGGQWTAGDSGVGDGQPYGAPFSPAQRSALHSYTEELSDVNSYLRNGMREPYFAGATDAMRERAKQDVALMLSAARPLPRDRVFLRGVDGSSFDPKFSDMLEQMADARYGDEKDLEAQVLQRAVGTVLRDKGFLSCTTDPEVQKYSDAPIQMHIRVPAGTPVVNIGNDIGRYQESEQLLVPGTGIKITSIRPSSNERGDEWWTVYGKVVP